MQSIITCVVSFIIAAIGGRFLIPALRALHVGQSIREVGPTWHNSKQGTPVMGGLMFIGSALICVLTALYIPDRVCICTDFRCDRVSG